MIRENKADRSKSLDLTNLKNPAMLFCNEKESFKIIIMIKKNKADRSKPLVITNLNPNEKQTYNCQNPLKMPLKYKKEMKTFVKDMYRHLHRQS